MVIPVDIRLANLSFIVMNVKHKSVWLVIIFCDLLCDFVKLIYFICFLVTDHVITMYAGPERT